jgi:hypothetical protein
MSWRDAMITLKGVRLREEEGVRMLGQILKDLWSDKQGSINQFWILPYDNIENDHLATRSRLLQRQHELKQKQQNGSS